MYIDQTLPATSGCQSRPGGYTAYMNGEVDGGGWELAMRTSGYNHNWGQDQPGTYLYSYDYVSCNQYQKCHAQIHVHDLAYSV